MILSRPAYRRWDRSFLPLLLPLFSEPVEGTFLGPAGHVGLQVTVQLVPGHQDNDYAGKTPNLYQEIFFLGGGGGG